jgi:AcrR family transcriptional regulator
MTEERDGTGPDKRSRLTSAALELAYRQGYQRSTIADIAEEASVPVGNVYYYFKTKDDIGDAIIDRRLWEFARLRERLDKLSTPKERLLGFIDMTSNNRETVAIRGCPFGSLSAEFLKLGGKLGEAIKGDACRATGMDGGSIQGDGEGGHGVRIGRAPASGAPRRVAACASLWRSRIGRDRDKASQALARRSHATLK